MTHSTRPEDSGKHHQTGNVYLDSLSAMTDEELLIELGRAIAKEEKHVIPPSKQSLRKKSLRWLEKRTAEIRQIICKDKRVKEFVHNNNSTELLIAVMALLESLAFGSAAAPLAVLLCRRGINTLCKDVWS